MKIGTSLPIILSVVAMSTSTTHGGELFIDFETYPLPDGTLAATFDNQAIFDQYEAAFGVTFTEVDAAGVQVGVPRIAKVGLPNTAFLGCTAQDTPLPPAQQPDMKELGESFLTYSAVSANPVDLLITYTPPGVSQASGVLIDTDCRACPSPCVPCESWRITARDSTGATLKSNKINALQGLGDPTCIHPFAGPGDGLAIGWSFSVTPPQKILSILIEYTGDPGTGPVGIAFDNFNTAGLGVPPPIPTVSAWGLIVLALMLAVGAKLYFGRRYPEPTE